MLICTSTMEWSMLFDKTVELRPCFVGYAQAATAKHCPNFLPNNSFILHKYTLVGKKIYINTHAQGLKLTLKIKLPNGLPTSKFH